MATPAFKTMPEVRLRVQGRSAIPKGGTAGYPIAVIFSQLLGTGGGSSTGSISGLGDAFNPLLSRAWNETASAKAGQALEFVRFYKDGTVTFGASNESTGGEDEFSGWMLRRIETPLDARGPGDAANADKALQVLEQVFESITGTHRGVMAGTEGQARGLVNVGAQGSSEARTTLPKNFATRWTIKAQGLIGTGTAAGTPGNVRIAFGEGLYGALLTHGKPPILFKRVGNQDVSLSTLAGAQNVDLRSGTHELRFFRIGGRGIIGWGGRFWYWCEYATREAAQRNERAELVPVEWPAGSASVRAIGCRVRVNLASIKFDTEAPVEERQVVINLGKTNYAGQGDTATGAATGWLQDGSAVLDIEDAGNVAIATLTLSGSADRLGSPVCNKVTGMLPDSPYNPGSGDYFDASHAVRSAQLSMAYPPLQAGATLSMRLDRKHLDRIGEAAGVEWSNFIQENCVVEFSSRWHYSDNSVGPWTGWFKGFGLKLDAGTDGVNSQWLSMMCYDPVVLLQNPAGAITHQDPPLDLFWLRKLAASNNQTNFEGGPYNPYAPPIVGTLPQNVQRLGYYIGDAVRDILYLKRGPEAARLFVNMGDDDYPLLTSDSDPFGYVRLTQVATGDSQSPSVNGWALPLTFGQFAIDEIYNLCQKANALFFYGYKADDDFSDFPRPVVTTLEKLSENRRRHDVYDTIFDTLGNTITADAVNKTMTSIQREGRPEANYNHAIATSNGLFQDALDGVLPYPRMAEARLPDSDVNSEAQSWRRTKFLDAGPLGGFPGGVESLASVFIALIRGTGTHAWPHIELSEGRCYFPEKDDYPVVQGDEVKLHFNGPESDTGLGLNQAIFRNGQTVHNWDLGGPISTHTSQLSTRPLSNGSI